MDTVAPEAPEPSATAEATAERAAPKRRWRVPTSIVVTFLGIALTAWLLPAFTHQWEDRQKAQELKATIVADVASASARALVGGEAIWAPRKVDREKVADEWSRSSLAIETRLRAYLPEQIVTAWKIYTWMIDRFVDGHRVQGETALLTAAATMVGARPGEDLERPENASLDPEGLVLDPGAVIAAKDVFGQASRAKHPLQKAAPSFKAGTYDFYELQAVKHYLEVDQLQRDLNREEYNKFVQSALVIFQQELTREILAAHVAGYSTTSRDLLNDLLPF